VGSDTEDVNLAGGVVNDEERVEPGEVDGVDVEQVAGQDRVGLGAEEVAPGGLRPPCGGVDAGSLEDFQAVEAPCPADSR
jgi:hypothetical protein